MQLGILHKSYKAHIIYITSHSFDSYHQYREPHYLVPPSPQAGRPHSTIVARSSPYLLSIFLPIVLLLDLFDFSSRGSTRPSTLMSSLPVTSLSSDSLLVAVRVAAALALGLLPRLPPPLGLCGAVCLGLLTSLPGPVLRRSLSSLLGVISELELPVLLLQALQLVLSFWV